MKRQQSGFTLIELIMVIVILGILSAFALPKFADLSGDAELAAIEGAFAAAKSASSIAHAQSLVSGTTDGDIDLEGTDVTMVNGYPSADDADTGTICDAAGIDATSGFSCADDGATPPVMTVTLDSNTSCTFTYTEAAAADTPPVFGAPSC